ncbi:hypothetical protein PRIPAC_92365 [Pristionchus pacificus]|uniref:Arb2 domain-containing protein n=1 Tax=Pristionchus pacificus TaxID=54126 RepID=A0A2A6CD77_PRIPA|nr:hypothetical protein PRIPAC_92365 [Pristionchus pacificus]|eukprot:PDM76144.1 hypothetical protein PRIPAC_39748 [Pristionchus pacificus]
MNGDNSALRKRKSTASPTKMGATVSKLFGWGTKTKEEEAAPSSSKTDVADVETLSSRIAAGGDDDATSKVVDDVEMAESLSKKDDDGPPALDRQDDQPSEELPLDSTPDSSPAPSPVKTADKEKVEDVVEAKDAQKEEEDIKEPIGEGAPPNLADGTGKEVTTQQPGSSKKVDKVVEKTPPPLRSSSSRGKKTIADFGYHLVDGKLRTIEGDEGFKFTTQREYEQLGDLIGDYVYELLEAEGVTKRYLEVGRNRRFYFASRDYEKKHRILVLIHGSGVVKAGQWARRLIINESLERGTQLPYVKRALALDWGVVVINYNETCVGQTKGCHGPDAHGTTEMRFALKHRDALNAEIVVVAHSAGGGVISSAIKDMHRLGDDRVLCVALTDSWFSEGQNVGVVVVFAVNFHTTKKQLSRRAGVFQMFSGDVTHEGSSSSCINACFALLEGVTVDTTNDDFIELLADAEQIISAEYKEKQRAKRRQEAGDTASVKSLELEKAKGEEAIVKKKKKEEEEGTEKEEKKEEKEGEAKEKEEVKKEDEEVKKEKEETKEEDKESKDEKDTPKKEKAVDDDGATECAGRSEKEAVEEKDASPRYSDTEN